jgi:hypothetical protein
LGAATFLLRAGTIRLHNALYARLHMEAEQMRHDAERYRMLLESEKNPRVRRVLTNMIQELESRVHLSKPPEAKQGSPEGEELSTR